jgi:uncharacterized Zn finger protein (UPF0148 family)
MVEQPDVEERTASPAVACPKCGFPQSENAWCPRCGFRLGRQDAIPAARPEAVPVPATSASPQLPEPSLSETQKPGVFRRVFRVVRWVSLAVTLVLAVLLLRPAKPPVVRTDPKAAERVQAKIDQAAQTAVEGQAPVLQMDEAELNAWIQTNLALQAPPQSELPSIPGPSGEPTLQQVQSSLRDVKINLIGEELRAYVLFNLYGKDLTLQLEGRLVVTEGRLRLRPTRGMLGSLPIPQITLDRAVSRLFDSPENRESFQLPPEIKDIRVVNGELIVSYR